MFCYNCKSASKTSNSNVLCSIDGNVHYETHKCHIDVDNVDNIFTIYGNMILNVHTFSNAISGHASPKRLLEIVDEVETNVKELQEYLRKKAGI